MERGDFDQRLKRHSTQMLVGIYKRGVWLFSPVIMVVLCFKIVVSIYLLRSCNFNLFHIVFLPRLAQTYDYSCLDVSVSIRSNNYFVIINGPDFLIIPKKGFTSVLCLLFFPTLGRYLGLSSWILTLHRPIHWISGAVHKLQDEMRGVQWSEKE